MAPVLSVKAMKNHSAFTAILDKILANLMHPHQICVKFSFSPIFTTFVSLFFRFSVIGTMQTPGRGQRYFIDCSWYHRKTILASLSTDLPTHAI